MQPLQKLIVMALMLSSGSSLLAQSALPTPPDVWADYDPDQGDFNEQIVREETQDGIFYRDSYISAYVLGNEVRVYCKYAVKAGVKNAPGLMNVHGWMGAPSIDIDYVNDGWAVMSHDYCGDNGKREHFTKYPKDLRYGNMDAQVGYRVKSKLPNGSFITEPKQTDDYLWYAIDRRALSYLLAQKEVDRDRIGAKGYSYGGTIMWNLGMDPRVKAVVAYFGIGWLEYYRSRGIYMYNVPPNNLEPTAGEKLYLSTVAPQAHAPHITAASLWLNGTNDHHGGHERGEQTFKSFSKEVPWSFAHQPRGHHHTQDIGHNTKLWLNKHVLGKEIHWPELAQSKIVLNAKGVPELHIFPADPDRVTELKMYYALKNPVSYVRAWRDCETMVRRGDTWVGSMPVMNVDDYVFGFGNIRYDNTVVRSSPFTAAIPSKLGKAKATDKPSNQLSEGTGAWVDAGPVEGKGGIKGFRALNRRGVFNEQFSDPKWQAPAGALLAFKFYCTQPQDLILVVDGQNDAKIHIPASNDWQEMSLEPSRFINRQSKQPLQDWSNLRKLQLTPAPGNDITKVVFADFRWQTKPGKKAAQPRPDTKPKAKKEIPAGQRVYLKKEMATVAESFRTVNNNRAWQGSPIRFGGKTYKRGLGVHADSKLVFDLNGEFATFHVVPGPDDAHKGVLSMKILVDEKEVFSSGPTSSRDKKARRPLNIDVTAAQQLTLLVSAGDNRGGDHASWADLWLERPSKTAYVPPVIEHASTGRA